jgi:hypothetical protein
MRIVHHQRLFFFVVTDHASRAVIDHEIFARPVEFFLVEFSGLGQSWERLVLDHGVFRLAVDGHLDGAQRAHFLALAAEDALDRVNLDRLFANHAAVLQDCIHVFNGIERANGRADLTAHAALQIPAQEVMARDHGAFQDDLAGAGSNLS